MLDRYSKVVLTVIALALASLALQSYVIPAKAEWDSLDAELLHNGFKMIAVAIDGIEACRN